MIPLAGARREPPPPRIWPALTLLFAGPPAVLLSAWTLARAVATLQGAPRGGFLADASPLVFLSWNILPVQAGLLLLASLAAAASPARARGRLGFVRTRAGTLTKLLLLPATLLPLGVGAILSLLFLEPGEELLRITERILAVRGPAVVPVALLLTLLPALCEETFFRGFVQRRLLRRWPPVAAIGLTALVFAAFHGDPYHAVGVLPLGLWFGYVAWTTRSVWPAIACHAFNNAYVSALKWISDGDELAAGVGLGLMAVSITCFPMAVRRLERGRRGAGHGGD